MIILLAIIENKKYLSASNKKIQFLKTSSIVASSVPMGLLPSLGATIWGQNDSSLRGWTTSGPPLQHNGVPRVNLFDDPPSMKVGAWGAAAAAISYMEYHKLIKPKNKLQGITHVNFINVLKLHNISRLHRKINTNSELFMPVYSLNLKLCLS